MLVIVLFMLQVETFFVKELSKPKIIRFSEDVDEMLLEATTKKPVGRRSQNVAEEVDEDEYISS